MQQIINFFKTYLTEYRKNWPRYLLLFFGMNIFLSLIVLPLFGWVAGAIMRLSGIPYLSYNNLSTLVSQHLLGLLGLLVLLALLIVLIYWQFAFQLTGLVGIQAGRPLTVILRESLSRRHRLTGRTLGFFCAYFLLILPFSRFVFSTPLLAKVKIPIFTLEFFLAKPQNMAILGVFYLLTFMIGSSLLLVLPLTVLQDLPLSRAIRQSFQLMRANFWHFLTHFAAIGIFTVGLSQALYYSFYGLQILADRLTGPLPLIAAVLNLTAIELVNALVMPAASMLLFSLLVSKLGYRPSHNTVAPSPHPSRDKALPTSRRRPLRQRLLALLLLSAATALLLFANTSYLTGLTTTHPLTIAHRGVNRENGVQNTIPALQLTAKQRPDYVEMDVQETADHQFVVMHDANLTALAGVNKTPQALTLSQLTALTVRENGHSAKIPSFDDYLSAAEKAHQKLLVEIKTTPADSPDLLSRFVKRYAARLHSDGDRLHSLDYRVVTGLQQRAPDLSVSFILPFNIIFPQTHANAYTMEETTLTSDFVSQAHSHHQQVLAWTVNDAAGMQRQLLNGVDGIITDDLTTLKAQVNTYETHPTYADRLRLFFAQTPTPGNNAAN